MYEKKIEKKEKNKKIELLKFFNLSLLLVLGKKER